MNGQTDERTNRNSLHVLQDFPSGPLPNKGKESQKEKLEDDNKVEEEETDEKEEGEEEKRCRWEGRTKIVKE